MMIATRFASLALVFVLATGLSYGALAQAGAPPQGAGDAGTAPNPAAQQFSVNQPVGDWAVRCAQTALKSPAPCDVIQLTVNQDTKARIMSFSLAYLPSRDSYAMQVIVPTGVAIQRGMTIAAGDRATRIQTAPAGGPGTRRSPSSTGSPQAESRRTCPTAGR